MKRAKNINPASFMQLDYRARQYYSKTIHDCRSNENLDGEGILISHNQMGIVEVPHNVFVKIAVDYLSEHGYKVENAHPS